MIRRAAALLIITILAATPPILACAPAPHAGERVDIVEESAVIQWDPATKTQHFIRRATFKGTARDFGFLVPTPTTPALQEASDDLFTTLEERTARKTVQKTTKRIDWTPLIAALLPLGHKGETATAGRAPVEVLSVQKLAGYEAAVLDAIDANALNKWLADNGYATTPDLAQWLDAYIKQGWKITAFKIDKSQGETAAQTSAVKMSFTTDRPFFPYREPASQRDAPYDTVRSLRIFFLGPERVTGTIGDGTFWPGVLTWSDRVDAVAGLSLPPNTRLTSFVDTSRIRPGNADLFFTRDTNQQPHVPPPYVQETVDKTYVPADVVALIVAAVVFVLLRRRR